MLHRASKLFLPTLRDAPADAEARSHKLLARGGYYGAGAPMATFEHAETYLGKVFNFNGITDVEVVAAEGLAVGPDARQAGIDKAHARIEALPA